MAPVVQERRAEEHGNFPSVLEACMYTGGMNQDDESSDFKA